MRDELEQLGNYPLLAKLGEGGMGAVYLGLHRGIGGFEKKVAIKCIQPHVAADGQFIDMLVEEAKLTAQLTHPNIVQVIDLDHSDGFHFLVMEYVEGCDVYTLGKSYELDLAEAVYLVAEAARGLAYAHRKTGPDGEPLNIVHRDISGHNILVSSEGNTKILDFGIAKAASKRQATQAGVLKGKIPYMSPEQATGKPLDGRSDLFSLGIVLWELCTRQRLFEGDTEIQTLMKVQQCEIEMPSRIVPGFPRALEEIIRTCLAKDPADRYPDGDRFADALTAFLHTHQGAEHPRSKLAQRVVNTLRKNPLQKLSPGAKTPTQTHLASAEKTVAAVQHEATQIVSSLATPAKGSLPGKPNRLRKLALLATVLLVMIGGGAWYVLSPHAQTSPVATADLKAKPSEVKQDKESPSPAASETMAARKHVVQEVEEPVQAMPPKVESPVAVAAVDPTKKPKLENPPEKAPEKAPAKRKAPAQATRKPEAKATQPKKSVAPAPQPKVAKANVPEAKAATGFLSLNATPWARVYINGKKAAESTPVLKLELPSGKHTVVLVNPELRIRKEVEINVKPGEHVRQRVKLQ